MCASGVFDIMSQVMIRLIQDNDEEICALCHAFGVRRLELFGSAMRDDFDPASSDFDFLVEFLDNSSRGAADNWFGLLEGLQPLLGRKVDLVSTPDIRNLYFLDAVNATRTELYAA